MYMCVYVLYGMKGYGPKQNGILIVYGSIIFHAFQ